MARSRRPAGALLCLLASFSEAQADDYFEQHIRPVLVEKCYSCHSAAASSPKGGLRLDSAAGLAKGGDSGLPAVRSKDPAHSLLMEAIRYQNPDLQMPPKEPLPAPVVEAFERWIQSGAPFPDSVTPVDLMAKAKEHWAFHPPIHTDPPPVHDASWPQTEVDHFILASLESRGLTPSPPADRRTLIRRLSFDLLGLPPSPEEVAEFVADPAPDAYAQLVERYLASPQYGERWARHWLDVARYADTKGYVYGDREAVAFTHSYVYRDWVVNALNADMPYDKFIKLQIAADELTDDASRTDLAAMGFLTLGPRFLGVMPDIIDDRIDTLTRGLMGLTVGCARCHDHKFDPIPTEDYYSLYGVFSASSERTWALNPKDLDDPKYAEFSSGMKEREAKLQERFIARSHELEERLRSQVDRYLVAVPSADSLPTDDFYEIRNAEDINPTIVRRWAAFIGQKGADDPVFGIWNRLAPLPKEAFANALAALLPPQTSPTPKEGDTTFANFEHAGIPYNAALVNALRQEPPSAFPDVAAAYAKLFKQANDSWLEAVKQAEAAGNPTPEHLADADLEAIRAEMFIPSSPIRVPEGAIVDLEWMFDEPSRVELATLHANIDRWITGAASAPPYAVVLVSKPDATPPRVFLRGSPANPGPEVPRQFLSVLAGETRQPFTQGSGRSELASAIASPDNPLTARVLVNRIWGWHFGTGLLDTPSDFGTRSAPPSHPELLDWLALDFIQNGWSLKQLHRKIVLSATYQQSSLPAEDSPRIAHASEADPENRLLWRFSARRLDFESLRDALLFVSGELDTTLGGKPLDITAPPYPTRRTLYGRVDRQFLPPVFRVFDFPNPDMHSPSRINTVVPQQALFLMNNPFVQAQARAFAARAQVAAEDSARVNWMYKRAYQRPASPAEVERCLAYVRDAAAITPPTPEIPPPPAWSYGHGKFNAETGTMATFEPLPHFTGTAWQGGDKWPDAKLGWAQLTAEGGHPGNTLDHAVVRRWTAPTAGKVNIEGRIRHARTEGDGIMARVLSSRHGMLGEWFLHNTESDANFYGITVEPGDTIDFVVDIKNELNSDEFLWAPVILEGTQQWNAKAEFAGPYEAPPIPLDAWEKFAQVLLSSNEFLYVD